jgi:hypothetical protein
MDVLSSRTGLFSGKIVLITMGYLDPTRFHVNAMCRFAGGPLPAGYKTLAE